MMGWIERRWRGKQKSMQWRWSMVVAAAAGGFEFWGASVYEKTERLLGLNVKAEEGAIYLY